LSIGFSITKRRLWTLVLLLIIIPIGFATKLYSGPGKDWVNNSLGGVFYEMFWCLFIYFVFIKLKNWKIAISVFIATGIIEIIQLWHPPFLEFIRSYFIGRTILGTSFSWLDFIYYFIGCGIGYLLLNRLHRLNN